MMNFLKSHTTAALASSILQLGVLGLFVLACWTAAADAQGAIAFMILIPVFGVMLFAAYRLAKVAARTKHRGKTAQKTSAFIAAYLLVFYLSSFIPVPGLNTISTGAISFVSETFQKMTGKTPYQWSREKSLKEAQDAR